MKRFTKLSLLIACIVCSFNISGITRISTCTGNWATASTWSPASVPACGDSVIILATHTVCITNQQNYNTCATPFKIVVYGNIKFFNGSKLNLPCNSYVLVYPGGKVEADVGLSNSNLISICGNVEWNSNTVLSGPACIAPTHTFCAGILPVELTDFKAETCGGRICLNWETATEINNDHFELERSPDGVNYTIIAAVRSKAFNGNVYTKTSYSAMDETPLRGINYFRLLQVDKDQSSTYSKVVAVMSADESGLQFSIFPNMNSGEFTAQVTGLRTSGYVGIIIRNETGTIIYKLWQHVNEGSAQIRVVPGWKIPNGFYFCSFVIGDKEQVVKLIVGG